MPDMCFLQTLDCPQQMEESGSCRNQKHSLNGCHGSRNYSARKIRTNRVGGGGGGGGEGVKEGAVALVAVLENVSELILFILIVAPLSYLRFECGVKLQQQQKYSICFVIMKSGGWVGLFVLLVVKYLNVTSYFKEKHQTNTLHFISFDLSKWLLKYDSLKAF